MKRSFAGAWIGWSILWLVLVSAAWAQEKGSLAGVVVDARTGQGVSGAYLMLEESGQGTTTDDEGAFRLVRLQPGAYYLIASHIGYRTTFVQVAVAAGEETGIALSLQPEPIPMQRILIAADPAANSAASSRSMREFDLRVRPRRSSHELLQTVPGLMVARQAGGKAAQIFLRGFDSGFGTDVAISVDGMPVNLVSHGHGQGYADLSFLIPETVERAEVFKGPYFAEFGNLATAGQIALFTRQFLDQNSIRVERGAFNTTRGTALYALPNSTTSNSAYFAGDFYRTDGPFESPQDLHRMTLFARVHRRLGEDAVLSAAVGGVNSSWDASGMIPTRAVESGRISRWGAINDTEGGSTERLNLSIAYQTLSEDRGDRLTTQFYCSRYNLKLFSDYTFFFQDPIFGDMIEQTDSRLVAGLNNAYRFGHSLGPVLAAMTLGGGLRSDDIDLALWQVVKRRRYWPLVEARVGERNYFFWGQEELIFGPRWRLILGLRGDYFTFQVEDQTEIPVTQDVLPFPEWIKQLRTGARGKLLHVPLVQPHASGIAHQALLSPKASLIHSPTPSLDLFANIGAGFHSNDARSAVIGQFVRDQWQAMEQMGATEAEIAVILDTLNFAPEQREIRAVPRTRGAEIGFRVRLFTAGRVPLFSTLSPGLGHYPGNVHLHAPVANLKGNLNLGAALWWVDVDDEFIYVAAMGTQEQRGATRRWGVDLEARAQMLSWLWADADLNWVHGHLRDAPENANAIPLAPRFTSSGGLTALAGEHWEWSLRYRRIDDRPASVDGRLTAAGYSIFDLNVAYHRGPLKFDLVVENLFDVEWREAQFVFESLLPGEGEMALRGPGPPPEIHFIPGNPRNVRLGVKVYF